MHRGEHRAARGLQHICNPLGIRGLAPDEHGTQRQRELPNGERILPVVRKHGALLARFAAPQFLVATGAGFCIPFLPTYFQERFGVTPDGWGYLFASGQVLMTAGFLITPVLLSRYGFVRSMVGIELSSLPFSM